MVRQSMITPSSDGYIALRCLLFRGNATEGGMPDIIRHALPLNIFQKTLIIAGDTNGIQHRGYAEPGTVGHTYRTQSGLYGGLKCTNPFTWNGWNLVSESSCKQSEDELQSSFALYQSIIDRLT